MMLSAKNVKTIIRGQDYKFINWGDVNHLSWLKEPINKALVLSAFYLYCEKVNSSVPTLDKTFCDHIGKKCNGRNALDKAIAIEAVTLFSQLSHAQLKSIRGKYGYDNRDILRAVTGRAKKGKASVGSKAVQAAQVDVILNMLRQKAGKSIKHVDYQGGTLKTIDTSDEFKAFSKKVFVESQTLNDRLEGLILKQAIAMNARIDAGTMDKTTFKPIRKAAPKTAKAAQSKTA